VPRKGSASDYTRRSLLVIAVTLLTGAVACDDTITGEHAGDHHDGDGEESGLRLAPDEIFDEVRNGVRLILAYDPQSNTFVGTVENTIIGRGRHAGGTREDSERERSNLLVVWDRCGRGGVFRDGWV
jgi:hypothetical protein